MVGAGRYLESSKRRRASLAPFPPYYGAGWLCWLSTTERTIACSGRPVRLTWAGKVSVFMSVSPLCDSRNIVAPHYNMLPQRGKIPVGSRTAGLNKGRGAQASAGLLPATCRNPLLLSGKDAQVLTQPDRYERSAQLELNRGGHKKEEPLDGGGNQRQVGCVPQPITEHLADLQSAGLHKP